MNFKSKFKSIIEIIKLNEEAIRKAAKEDDSWKWGLFIIIIGSIIGTLTFSFAPEILSSPFESGAIQKFTPFSLISAPIVSIIFTLIGVGIIHFIAKLFGGKGTYKELFSVYALSSILSWLAIINFIPFCSFFMILIGIYSIVISIIIVKTIYNLSLKKAIWVIIIPLIILMIILIIIISIIAITTMVIGVDPASIL